jgi:hypothetical protein
MGNPAKRGPIRRAEPAASGREVASVAEGKPPASQGPRWHPANEPYGASRCVPCNGAPSAEQPRKGVPSGAYRGGRASADLRVYRKSSDFAKGPPPRMREPFITHCRDSSGGRALVRYGPNGGRLHSRRRGQRHPGRYSILRSSGNFRSTSRLAARLPAAMIISATVADVASAIIPTTRPPTRSSPRNRDT